MPAYVAGLVDTFRQKNRDFDHQIFNARQAESFISEHVGLRERDAFSRCAIPAMQADYFRYCAVLAAGGIYADVDYRCIKALAPLLGDADGVLFHRETNYSILTENRVRAVLNSFFAFRDAGHPFLKLALDVATSGVEESISGRLRNAKRGVRLGVAFTVGPGIFSAIRQIHRLGSLNAFLRQTMGSPIEPFARLYCETIGDFSRVSEALEGVRLVSIDEMHAWIKVPTRRLPYKETGIHWANFDGPMFKGPPEAADEPGGRH